MSSLGGMVDAVEEVRRPAKQQETDPDSSRSTTASCAQAELELHGVLYSVSVLVHGDELLVVKIEDRDTLDAWHGEFAAKYVEDITGKTGSFKKFGVFVRMLTSAVLQQSDSVFVDLLTCADLELLKAKKAAAAAAAADQSDAGQQQQQQLRQLPPSLASKRYLILTYASEFDRVHYPLPLLADEQPDPARFKVVIASLRQQLADVTAGLALQQHRQPLQAGGQQQLLLGSGRARGWSGAGGQAEADAALLASRLEVAQAELEGQAAAHRREMRKKAREVQELQEELSRSRDVTRELRLRVTKLELELEAARSSLATAPAAGAGAGAVRGGPSKGGYRRPAAADRYTYGGGTSSSYLAGSSKFPSRPQQQQQYGGLPSSSRNSSRGSSPASSSRGRSPSYARPWAQGSPVSRPPRPSSAPPKQRFDPTEYVRQKREREQQRLAAVRRSTPGGSGGSRGGSPAHSVRSSSRAGGGDQSGASTPRSTAALSHASSSFERRSSSSLQGDRGMQPGAAAARGGGHGSSGGGGLYRGQAGGGYDAGGGRAGSSGRRASQRQQQEQRRPGSSGGAGYGYYNVGRPGSAGRLPLQQQRPGSSGSAASRDQLGAIYGVPAAAAAGGTRGGAAAAAAAGIGGSRPSSRSRLDRDTASGRDGPGAASPGRALQGVRDKLDAYYAKQQQQQQRLAAGVVRTTVQPSSPAGPPYKAAAAAAAAATASPRQQRLQRVPVVAAAAGSPSPAKAAAAAAALGGSGAGGISGGGGGVFQDASSEIADIDQRLHALQNFLKMAKSSVGGA